MASLPLAAELTRIERLTRVGADEVLGRWAESVRAEQSVSVLGDGTAAGLVESLSPVLARKAM